LGGSRAATIDLCPTSTKDGAVVASNEKKHKYIPANQFWCDTLAPPGEGDIKCNLDAALFEEQQRFGVGMCVRDSQGNFMKAGTLWYDGLLSPTEAEALGLRYRLTQLFYAYFLLLRRSWAKLCL
jgi:hypothetical protein